jgi:hypothetical protein
MSDDRFARQRQLPEIGECGQSLIAQADFEVRGSDGAIIESEYLHRAGAERVTLLPGAEPVPFEHERWFRYFASRRIGAGAWRALDKLRQTLGVSRP